MIYYFFKKYPFLINLLIPYIFIENIASQIFYLSKMFFIDNLYLKINRNKLKMTEYTTVLNLDDDDDIDYDLEKDNEILNDEENFKKNIFDMNLSLELRINIISKYYQIHPEYFLEIISRINGMYSFSGTKTLEKFIYYIITETNLSSFLKIESSMSLLNFKEMEEEIFEKDEESFKEIKRKSNDEIKARNDDRNLFAYKALNIVCFQLDEKLPTPYKFETICELMKNGQYKEESLFYFFKIINNEILDCDYRYKTILSLERRDIDKKFFIFESCLEFLKKSFNFTMYRILASQNLLQNFEIPEEKRCIIENTLLSFAKDEELEYNLRADAADVLLNLGSENMQKEGRNIIFSLGQINGVNKTIFDNAQNVHVTEIEKSVLEIIKKLSNYPTMRLENDNLIDYEYVQNEIDSVIDNLLEFESDSDMVKKNRIQISFNRIYMDKALYFNNSVSNILVKVWSYINNNENKTEMIKRLVEELDEMSGTCSSGFASRIINSITGFGEFNLHISWEDQIVSNFSGRLNAYARKITNVEDSLFFTDEVFNEVLKLFIIDNKLFSGMNIEMEDRKKKYLLNKNIENVKRECIEEFSEHVINEMTVTSSKFANRQHFLLFFKTYMPLIYKELFEEFKNLITDSEFDLSFRRAISFYEGDI